jgi:hypothetical protein
MIGRRAVLGGLAALPLARAARAAGDIGTTLSVSGDTWLTRAGNGWPLVADHPLLEGDVVATSAGFAALMLFTQTQINLGPGATFRIDRFIADVGGVITVGGPMVFDRPDDLAPLDLAVQVSFAQIGVRGTRFFTGLSNGVESVFVQRGSVTVGPVVVAAGEGVELPGAGLPPGPVQVWGDDRIAAAFASAGVSP